MTIPIGIVTPRGIENAPYKVASLAEAAAKEPQGVYTVGRTYKRNKVLLFDQHLDRLERSATLEHIDCKLDRPAIRQAMRVLIDQSGYAESRFRITIPADHPDQPIISIEPFTPVPAEIVEHGARVVTVAAMHRRNPVAKTTDWMTTRQTATEAFPPDIYEGVLVSPDGFLLEGLSSNFYGIMGGKLRTAGEQDVLSGIARMIVLKVATSILPVEFKPVHKDEIGSLQEAFLTSAGRGVLPIVEIDGITIGMGQPGPLTLQLRHAYDDWANAHLDPL